MRLVNKSNILYTLAITAIILLFSFLRLYSLKDSFLFFNDIGRDLYVLQQWQQTGKPPLLGPQTSALPFNQSAVYFYMLFPFFQIFNHSVYSTILASLIIHIAIFILGAYWLRNNGRFRTAWLLIWLLFSVHPQFIIQHRFVWNPSFVGATVLMAFYFFMKELKDPRSADAKWIPAVKKGTKALVQDVGSILSAHRYLLLLALSIAWATALSYSAAPIFFAFVIVGLILMTGKRLPFILSLAASLFLVNLPTVVFELRHNFVLTNLMLYGEKLTQAGSSLEGKLAALKLFIFEAGSVPSLILGILFLGVIGFELFSKRESLNRKDPFVVALLLFVLTVVFTLAIPVSIHPHYIFAILTSALLVVVFARWQAALAFSLIAVIVWLTPAKLNSYFAPAFRSTENTIVCVEKVCSQIKEPIFISVQAGYHPYHNGYEYKYLMGEYGCQVRSVETEPAAAEYMAVFADGTSYEHNRTAYNELTQFGSSEEIQKITCTDELSAHILKRLPAATP